MAVTSYIYIFIRKKIIYTVVNVSSFFMNASLASRRSTLTGFGHVCDGLEAYFNSSILLIPFVG